MKLSQEELKEILHYNTETGNFTWLVDRANGSVKGGDIAGNLRKDGYISIGIYGKSYLSHRLAWLYMTGGWPKFEIDHIDGINIPNFNKFSNLRDTDKNNWNRGENKNNTTGYIGVCFDKDYNKYKASISVNNKDINLGRFNTPEEASEAYLEAKLKYHIIQ